ncbi:MAG: hypothetical protein IRZ10_08380 [Thermoflavifilum sp.]|nr:hypothetical protein [Thermoflavifilum sp.]MCL6514428.1 hypothetical protein [Alicyclobacillus sp.]
MDAMFRQRGVVMREIDGLPFKVHQVAKDGWQICIDNCERLPAGYTFPKVYRSFEEAVAALAAWPETGRLVPGAGQAGGAAGWMAAGDDTGVIGEMAWDKVSAQREELQE